MFNERTPSVSPYPVRSPLSVPSQQNLHTTGRGGSQNYGSNGVTKSYLLQKVQALLPYLGQILKQNDTRTQGIVGKLSHLRENLDYIFEDAEKELALSGNQNEALRDKLRSMQGMTKVVEVKRENVEARRRIEAEIDNIRREN